MKLITNFFIFLISLRRGFAKAARALCYRRAGCVSRPAAGFTFIEILVVMVILALLVGIVGTQLLGEADKAKVDSTRLQIRSLQTSLDLYRLHSSFYPTTEQGLVALLERPSSEPQPSGWQGPYLKGRKLPSDAWKRPFIYLSDGNNYRIVSYGADGRQGGEELAADISSEDF